jgi:hypothetical protein
MTLEKSSIGFRDLSEVTPVRDRERERERN